MKLNAEDTNKDKKKKKQYKEDNRSEIHGQKIYTQDRGQITINNYFQGKITENMDRFRDNRTDIMPKNSSPMPEIELVVA